MSGARNLQAYLPGSPIVVDAPNGDLRVEWRHFFAQLWERTGGSQGTPPGGSGTITGVTADVGLSGGGTSGVVALSLTIPVTIGHGGTGATTAPQALQNLGGISDAPSTLQAYGRFNATWAQVLSLQYGGIIQGPVQLLSAPVLPTDAATKGYVDAAIAGTAPGVASFNTRTGAVTLNNADVTTVLAGATLTGPLTLAVDGSTALMPVTVQQFNVTVALLAPLASPALTGTPTAPTAPAGTNSTRIATTAYADNLNALTWG